MILKLAKGLINTLGIDAGKLYQSLSAASLRAAIREQDLEDLCERLRQVVPDLREQLTGGFDDAEYERYWEWKMRGMHSWQVRLTLDALEHIGTKGQVIADIGDSSGNHGIYTRALAPEGRIARSIGINLDPVAVEKIKAKGVEAILCRAEELDVEGIKADLITSFQTLEHLTDPVRFLHNLATRGSIDHLLLTVPYRRTSRFGGDHLRLPIDPGAEKMTAEEVHMYEFSPEDWTLLARFAGWSPVFTNIYYQYPKRSPLILTSPLWRALDFEGFLGLFLKRDLSLADRYADW